MTPGGGPSPEYVAERRRLEALGSSIDSAEEIVAHIEQLSALRARFTDEFVVLAPDGPIVWANHEHLAWALGESIRQALQRHRALRKHPTLWAAIETVVADRRIGKGREPYVMLLGQYGGPSRAPLLIQLLDDPEVMGHALYALRLLGVPGAEEKARALLDYRRGWIRKEAKSYLKKVGAL